MLKRIGRVAGYVVYLLAFVEVCLQGYYYFVSGTFLWKRNAVAIYRPDPYMVYGVKPDLSYRHATSEFDVDVYTNREGFRTSAAHENHAPGKGPRFRILLLGPSFAFGWGVSYEDSFAAQLQRALEAGGYGGGRAVEIVNAGVPAMLAGNQLYWFDMYGRKYSPDLVIQLAYSTMALQDGVYTTLRANSDGYLERTDATTAQKIQAELKRFALVHYGFVLYTAVGAAAGVRISLPAQEKGGGAAFAPDRQPARASLEFYRHLARSAATVGAALLVVYVPLSFEIHHEDESRWTLQASNSVYKSPEYNERFCEYLDANRMPCRSVAADLATEAQRSGERLYYWLDIHWTPKGNRVAAGAVARYLLEASARR